MTDAIVPKKENGSIIESVVIGGDLSKLTPEQRVSYYRQVCDSLGLNPLTRPFDYIVLNGKLTLYARKDASEQLRRINKISIDKPDISYQEDWIIVSVLATTPDGRRDSDIGVVSKKDMRGDFGNAIMKAVTKAKRRVTLSICGLGMLDETEVETIPNVKLVDADPISVEHDAPAPIEQNAAPMTLEEAQDMLNSQQVRYGDLPTDKLSIMANKMNSMIGKGEGKPEYDDKLLAISLILAARNAEAEGVEA